MQGLAFVRRHRQFVQPLARLAVVRKRLVQKAALLAPLQLRQQRSDGFAHIGGNAQLQGRATPKCSRVTVHLHNRGVLRIELAIREIRTQHDQGVAIEHGVIAGAEADQAGHADIERVIPLHMLLAAQRMHDRRAQRVGQRHHRIVRPGTAAAAEQRHRLALLQDLRELLHILGRRQQPRCTQHGPRGREVFIDLHQRDVAGNHHHRHALLQDRSTHRTVEHLRQLRRIGHQLDEVTAFAEQLLRMRLLEIAQADLGRRDMRGNGKHRLPAAVAIEQPIDQMQIARPATAGAHRQLAGHRGFGPGGECRHLFVAHMHPFDALHLAQRIGQPIETIAGHPPDSLHPGTFQRFGHEPRHRLLLRHDAAPLLLGRPMLPVRAYRRCARLQQRNAGFAVFLCGTYTPASHR